MDLDFGLEGLIGGAGSLGSGAGGGQHTDLLPFIGADGLADCSIGFFIGVGQPGDEIEGIGAGDMVETGEIGLCDHGRVGNVGKCPLLQAMLGQIAADAGQELIVKGLV